MARVIFKKIAACRQITFVCGTANTDTSPTIKKAKLKKLLPQHEKKECESPAQINVNLRYI
jgi:hypothetical protein